MNHQPRQDARDTGDRWRRWQRGQLCETPKAQERHAGPRQVPSPVRPTDHAEPPAVCDGATSADQPAGGRGEGESAGEGGGNSCRHTHASQAFRGWPRCVNMRVRRYVPQRSNGRGCGWQRFPNSTLSAMGRVSMGRGMREDMAKPAHGGRGRLSDRRTREHRTYGGMGREGGTGEDKAREALPWRTPQQQLGVV